MSLYNCNSIKILNYEVQYRINNEVHKLVKQMPPKILILAFLSGAEHLGDSDSENSTSSFLAALRGQKIFIFSQHFLYSYLCPIGENNRI